MVKVGIFGAGAIGGYIGVRLQAAGASVTMVGRASMVELAGRMEALDIGGVPVRAPGVVVTTEPERLSSVDVCLVTVKSRDTQQAARTLKAILRPEVPVVSLQNGLRNVERLRQEGLQALAGLVTFNVVREGPRFAKGTSGPILVERDKRIVPLEAVFAAAREPFALRDDIQAVQAGKLLLNLNNGVCAATGLPIVESLRDPDGRWCFSECIREGRRALAAARRPVTRIGVLSPGLVQRALRLPTPVFTRLASGMMKVDPRARSSTLQDLDRKKPTEIDDLNGEVVRLAEKYDCPSPVNRAVVRQVRRLEAGEAQFITPTALRRARVESSAVDST